MSFACRTGLAAGLAAYLLAGVGAAPASGQTPDSLTFGRLPTAVPSAPPPSSWARHRITVLATGTALALGSLLGSELLLTAANHRYDDYLATADPVLMEQRFQDARRLDRWSNAFLVLGEALAVATLVVAWRAPSPRSLELAAAPIPGGVAVRLAWNP